MNRLTIYDITESFIRIWRKKLEELEIRKKLENYFQQIDYYISAKNKYYQLRDSLATNCDNYSNEVFKIIDEIVADKEREQFVKEIPVGTILYRARKIRTEEYEKSDTGLNIRVENNQFITTGFNEKNSVECPIGIGFDGRNNAAGASYLYAAEDMATACAEIKTNLRSLISVAEFEVKSPLTVIDFSKDDKKFTHNRNDEYGMSLGRFITLLMLEYCQPASSKEDYKVTQIISDYIRKMGFDGIIYRSFFTMKNNYTIFNCHRSKIAFKQSRIVVHQFENSIFWDFNNRTSIRTDEHNNVEYNADVADEILQSMKRTFKEG
jgi:hypothetical protein